MLEVLRGRGQPVSKGERTNGDLETAGCTKEMAKGALGRDEERKGRAKILTKLMGLRV